MISNADLEIVSKQLGRPARSMLEVSARCICGNPVVVKTSPRLDDGTPFPTLYYLTHPAATASMSRLESAGLMTEWGELLVGEIGDQYLSAHRSYLAERESIEVVDELKEISAGGMPNRVKCLHALAAHSLAVGEGINPIGDLAVANSDWKIEKCQCDEPKGVPIR
jgi:hypothetical protein